MATIGILMLALLVPIFIGLVPTTTDGRSWTSSGGGILGALLVVVLLLSTSVRF